MMRQPPVLAVLFLTIARAAVAQQQEPVPELLPPPPDTRPVDEDAIHLRRTMLNVHQGLGLGMFGLALANTVVGQLNYSDKFGSAANTGRYQLAHQITAYGTLAAFTATGLLAVFAPNPLPKSGGFDRTTLHKVAMFTAAAGMATEGVLGFYTAQREGYLDQHGLATAHLVIGYVTFAALSLGVGAIVF